MGGDAEGAGGAGGAGCGGRRGVGGVGDGAEGGGGEVICIHCEHKFIGNAFVRGSGRVWVAMRRCPKCEREFVAPPKPRAPGKIEALQAEIDALRAQLDEARKAATIGGAL